MCSSYQFLDVAVKLVPFYLSSDVYWYYCTMVMAGLWMRLTWILMEKLIKDFGKFLLPSHMHTRLTPLSPPFITHFLDMADLNTWIPRDMLRFANCGSSTIFPSTLLVKLKPITILAVGPRYKIVQFNNKKIKKKNKGAIFLLWDTLLRASRFIKTNLIGTKYLLDLCRSAQNSHEWSSHWW